MITRVTFKENPMHVITTSVLLGISNSCPQEMMENDDTINAHEYAYNKSTRLKICTVPMCTCNIIEVRVCLQPFPICTDLHGKIEQNFAINWKNTSYLTFYPALCQG